VSDTTKYALLFALKKITVQVVLHGVQEFCTLVAIYPRAVYYVVVQTVYCVHKVGLSSARGSI